MRKILLASTALVAVVGVSAANAEISLIRWLRFRLIHLFSDDHNR